MSQITIIDPENAVSNPGFDRFESIPTVSQVKKRYLFGVNLTNKQGEKMPNETIAFFIKQAISELEHELNITITPTTYTETQDYRSEEYAAWGYMQLRRYPVISVESLTFRLYTDNDFVTVPNDWIRLERIPGQIQITPSVIGLSYTNFNYNAAVPTNYLWKNSYPSFFKFVYTAGFPQGQLPALFAQVIGQKAAIQAMTLVGDLALQPGISSMSLSIDGLSQSTGSYVNTKYGAYGARINQYNEDIKKAMETLKSFYGKNILVASC